MKITYDYINPDVTIENINNYIVPLSKNTPSWWKSLPVFSNGAKSVKEFLKIFTWNELYNSDVSSTVKICPGFKQHFNNSFLLKFPADLILETYEDGTFDWKSPSRFLQMSSHHYAQLPALGEKYIFLKFQYNITLKTSKYSQFSYVDPILFQEMEYKVSPGCSDFYYGELPLSIIAFFPRVNKRYYFKHEAPLTILQFSDPVSAIKKATHKDFNNSIRRGRNKFFNSKTYKK